SPMPRLTPAPGRGRLPYYDRSSSKMRKGIRLGEPRRDELTVCQERAVLVGVGLPGRPLDDFPSPLSELQGLAKTAGAEVVGDVTQNRQKPDPATYIGKGKLQELADVVAATDANVVIFDNE